MPDISAPVSNHPTRHNLTNRALKAFTALALSSSLIACGGDFSRSTFNRTNEIRSALSIAADLESNEINVVASISNGGSSRIRLVDGDYLSIETSSRSYELFRGQQALEYRNRSTIRLTDSEFPEFRFALHRFNDAQSDAPNSILRLPDLKSFSIDEANVLTASDGSLTGRWADTVNASVEGMFGETLEDTLSVEATVDSCTTLTGTVIDTITDPGLLLSIDPGVNSITVAATELSTIDVAETGPLSFCDFSVQLVSQEISVSVDPNLGALTVNAETRSPIVKISVSQTGGGA